MIQRIEIDGKILFVSDKGDVFNVNAVPFHKYKFAGKEYVHVGGYVCVDSLVEMIGEEG